ncbi:MAG: flagellar hook-associated protein FlgL [Candidatus Magnetoovum sp. WYHC-5]|nr:flagellar hook-associated protein FlgL [Candidatus Magnetoovum sp. WYHC-5]
MRVATFMAYDRTRKSFQDNFSKVYKSQEQLASGLKINRPSDDTIGMAKVLDYTLNIGKNDQYIKNIDNASTYLSLTDSVMDTVANNLQRVNELAVQGVSGQTDDGGRKDIAEEITVIAETLQNLANTKVNDRHIFGGYETNVSPFVKSGSSYSYVGDANDIKVNISQDFQVIENVTGSDAFAYTLLATQTIQLEDGNYVHYIPTAGSPVMTVRISTSSVSTDPGIEEFTFQNFMEITQQMADAFNNNNVDKAIALMKPVEEALEQVVKVRATVGARINMIERQRNNVEDNTLYVQGLKSDVEDADMAETVSDVAKAEIALEALRQTSANLLSQSLLDFIQ